MKKILTLAVAAATLLSAACSKSDDGGNYNAPIAVQIDPTIADPALFPKASTRVTDTDFETGDKIGVSITMEDNTQYLNNKEFSFDGTNFTAPSTLWYEDVNLASTLFAYYPYQAGAAHPTEFSVKADQNGDNYKASDLVIGAKTGVKPEKVVDLAFKHKMTRVIIRVTNGSGSDITEIRISGAIGTGIIDATTGAFTAKTDAATVDVKACERTKNQLYYALLVPQNGVKLITSVTTADGKTRPYTLGTTDLLSGTNRELKMNIQEANMQVKLGGPIDGWEDDADLEIDGGGQIIEPEIPTVAWGGVKYKIVTLKDGRTWMAENLRYVPEGKTPSSDPAANAGIWYPQIVVENGGAYSANVSTDADYIAKVGYYYDFCTAAGITELTAENSTTFEGVRGICPEGWHIPTNAELTALITAYKSTDGKTYWTDLDKDGFNTTLTQLRSRNTSDKTGAWAAAINANNHQFSGGWLMSSTANTTNNNNYKVNESTGAITSQNKALMFLNTYNANTGATNVSMSVSNASNFAGIPVRCIKDAE